jgi:outer membrane autotransporter protein
MGKSRSRRRLLAGTAAAPMLVFGYGPVAADVVVTEGTVAYDPASMSAESFIVDGDTATLEIGAGDIVSTSIELRNGGTLDNSGAVTRTGTGNRTVVGASGQVVNSGTMTAADATAILVGQGSVTNSGAEAVISGGFRGVAFQGGAGSVVNASGAYIGASGDIAVFLDSGGTVDNRIGSTISSVNGAMWTGGGTVLTNAGIIDGGEHEAVSIESGTIEIIGPDALVNSRLGALVIRGDGGSVTNSGGGLVKSEDVGVYLMGIGEVTNTQGSRIESALDGVVLDYGGTVTNSGGAKIVAERVGVVVWDAGTITNTGAGSLIQGNVGIDFSPYDFNGPFSLVNEEGASVVGINTAMRFWDSGSVTNRSGGLIEGNSHGVVFELEPGEVVNDGEGSVIIARGGGTTYRYAVYMDAGGTVTNTGGALISADTDTVNTIGVYLYRDGGTVTNGAGSTIRGGSAIHAFGDTTVVNAGTLDGYVLLERTAMNTVTLHEGGSVVGDLEMGDHSLSSLTVTGEGAQLHSEAVQGFTSFVSKLIKTGTGSWTIDRDLHTTIVNVDEGTLVVGLGGTGSLRGTVNVAPGARVGGSGTIMGNLLSDGAIAPGNSIGVLEVDGGYVANAGSVLEIEIDPAAGTADRIVATGGAAIAAGAELDVRRLGDGFYQPGTRFTVLTADWRSGTFTLTGDVEPSAFLRIEDEYDAQNVYLNVHQVRALASAALTGNQAALAAALDGAPDDNALRIALLNSADDAMARARFDAASGEEHASLQTALLADGAVRRGALLERMRGGEGSFWGRGVGSERRIDAGGSTSGLRSRMGGGMIGGDGEVEDGLVLGLMAGAFETETAFSASDAAIDSHSIGFYGVAGSAGPVLRFGAVGSLHDVDARSSFASEASYRTLGGELFAEIAHPLATPAGRVEPYAGISASALSASTIRDADGGKSGTGRAHLLSSDVGLRAGTAVEAGTVAIALEGAIGWRHVLSAHSGAEFQLAGGPEFSVTGAELPRDAALVSLGARLDLGAGASLGLGYEGSLSRGASAHAFRAGFALSF